MKIHLILKARTGLVQKQIQAKGKKGTYTQKVWVRIDKNKKKGEASSMHISRMRDMLSGDKNAKQIRAIINKEATRRASGIDAKKATSIGRHLLRTGYGMDAPAIKKAIEEQDVKTLMSIQVVNELQAHKALSLRGASRYFADEE